MPIENTKIKVFAPYAEKEPTAEEMEKRERAMTEKTCVVCMDAKIDTVCVPCGHLCLCQGCAPLIDNQGNCPYCRQIITKTIRTYI